MAIKALGMVTSHDILKKVATLKTFFRGRTTMSSLAETANLLKKLKSLEAGHAKLKKLPEEGSSKEFYRLIPQSSLLMIMKEKKPNRGSLKEWLEVQRLLKNSKIKVPEILEHLCQDKALLIEDCGNVTLTDKLNSLYKKEGLNALQNYYKELVLILSKLHEISLDSLVLKMDAEELERDLLFFQKHHILPRKKSLASIWNEKLFLEETKFLCAYLSTQKKSFTHRDFHSGNFILKNKGLFMIDFQDACSAPFTYDFVSLFLDPYVELKPKDKEKLFLEHASAFTKNLTQSQKHDFLDSLKAQSIHRLYKILGSYNFLGKAQKKEKFLHYIKPVLSYLETFDFYDSRWPYLTGELKKGLINEKK